MKKLAGWSSSLSPTIFATETGLITKPKQMADHINDYFGNKIKKICDGLSIKNKSDPLTLLKSNFARWKYKGNVKPFELKEVNQNRVRELFKL